MREVRSLVCDKFCVSVFTSSRKPEPCIGGCEARRAMDYGGAGESLFSPKRYRYEPFLACLSRYPTLCLHTGLWHSTRTLKESQRAGDASADPSSPPATMASLLASHAIPEALHYHFAEFTPEVFANVAADATSLDRFLASLVENFGPDQFVVEARVRMLWKECASLQCSTAKKSSSEEGGSALVSGRACVMTSWPHILRNCSPLKRCRGPGSWR